MTLAEIRQDILKHIEEYGSADKEYMLLVAERIQNSMKEVVLELTKEAETEAESNRLIVDLQKALQAIFREQSIEQEQIVAAPEVEAPPAPAKPRIPVNKTPRECLDAYIQVLRKAYIKTHRKLWMEARAECGYCVRNYTPKYKKLASLPPCAYLHYIFDTQIRNTEEFYRSSLAKRCADLYQNTFGLSDISIIEADFDGDGRFLDKNLEIGYWIYEKGEHAYEEYVKVYGEDELAEYLKEPVHVTPAPPVGPMVERDPRYDVDWDAIREQVLAQKAQEAQAEQGYPVERD